MSGPSDPLPPSEPSAPDQTSATRGQTPAQPTATAKPRRRHRLVVRLCVWPVLLIAFLLAVTGFVLTRPFVLTPMVLKQLTKQSGGMVTLGEARLAGLTTLTLKNLTLDAPNTDARWSRIFEADTITAVLNWQGLQRGKPVQTVTVRGARVFVAEETEGGALNLTRLEPPDREDDGTGVFDASGLPVVQLPGAQLVVREIAQDGSILQEARLPMNASAGPDETGQLVATVQAGKVSAMERLADVSAGGGGAARVTFDPISDMLNITVRELPLSPSLRDILTPSLKVWWDQLKPSGLLERYDVQLALDRPTARDRLVTMTCLVEDFAITLPMEVDGIAVPMRIEHIHGLAEYQDGRARLDAPRAQALGVSASIQGEVGLEPDDPMNLTIVLNNIEVTPMRVATASLLSSTVREIFAKYRPIGMLTGRVHLLRQEDGGPIRATTELEVHGAKFTYGLFPYPVEDVRGMIRIEPDRLELMNLTGKGEGDSTVTVTGFVSPLNDDAITDIRIGIQQLPLDRTLAKAMEPDHRKWLTMFLDPANHAKYLQGAPESIHQRLAKDDWTPGGQVDADVIVTRDPNRPEPTQLDIAIRPIEPVLLALEPWPYPLRLVDGEMRIGPTRIELDALELQGPTGARGLVNGELVKPDGQPNAPFEPKIRIESIEIPADELLLHSIPAGPRGIVAQVGLTGPLTGEGSVFNKDDGDVGYAFDVDLLDGTLQPMGGDVIVHGARSNFTLTDSSLHVQTLDAEFRGARVIALGQVDWSGQEPTMDLRLGAKGVPVDPALQTLVPSQTEAAEVTRELFETYRPEGVFDAQLTYKTPPGGGDPLLDLDLAPKQLRVWLREQRLQFDAMTGRALITPSLITLEDLGGETPGGSLSLSGLINTETGRQTLRLDGHSRNLGVTEQAVLPQPVLDVLKSMSFRGAYRLRQCRIEREPIQPSPSHEAEKPTRWRTQVEALVGLENASLQAGVEVSRLRGELAILVDDDGHTNGPRFTVGLESPSLRVEDRRIRNLRLQTRTDSTREAVLIENCRGSIYGGTVVGRGTFGLGASPKFELDLFLQDADLAPMIKPLEQDPLEDAKRLPPVEPYALTTDGPVERAVETALASANLTLAGTVGDPDALLGRGRLDVRNASLYREQPLTLSILQAINLSQPLFAEPFDLVRAGVKIDGTTAHIDPMRFESTTLVLTGAGTLDLESQALQLDMITRGPSDPRVVNASELLNLLRQNLFSIEVRGTLGEPKTRLVSLPGLRLPKLPGQNLLDESSPPGRR